MFQCICFPLYSKDLFNFFTFFKPSIPPSHPLIHTHRQNHRQNTKTFSKNNVFFSNIQFLAIFSLKSALKQGFKTRFMLKSDNLTIV